MDKMMVEVRNHQGGSKVVAYVEKDMHQWYISANKVEVNVGDVVRKLNPSPLQPNIAPGEYAVTEEYVQGNVFGTYNPVCTLSDGSWQYPWNLWKGEV